MKMYSSNQSLENTTPIQHALGCAFYMEKVDGLFCFVWFGVLFLFFFFSVLGFELRLLYLLGRRCTTRVTLPALFCVGYF
jgi:hypothetical protein